MSNAKVSLNHGCASRALRGGALSNGHHHMDSNGTSHSHGNGMAPMSFDSGAMVTTAAAATSYCCLPQGCPIRKDEPINSQDPGDAVKVTCNNDACSEGQWMHAACFQQWERHVLAFLRSCGRARSWSEKQRMQNLWTKKGYDLAFKACDCKCGRGHLRKDLDYIPVAKAGENGAVVKPKKNKKAKQQPALHLEQRACSTIPVSKSYGGGGSLHHHHHHHPPHHSSSASSSSSIGSTGSSNALNLNGTFGVVGSGKPQLRIRTSSFSSTGSSPPSSAGTPPLTPGGRFDFFADAEQAASGNIFRKRTDFSVFSVLPRHRQNPYHIKMEDEGPHGNDETRCFVLTNLSTHQVTSVNCVACSANLPIFDKYPLIDGTFFLSPQLYNTDLQVLFDHKMCYLNAVCMKCLTGAGRDLRCRACRTSWQGTMLVIGTMYSYDIFAAMPCCAQRLSCKNCKMPILDPGCPFQFFSEYSKVIQCPHCNTEDHHFIKPIHESFVLKQSFRIH